MTGSLITLRRAQTQLEGEVTAQEGYVEQCKEQLSAAEKKLMGLEAAEEHVDAGVGLLDGVHGLHPAVAPAPPVIRNTKQKRVPIPHGHATKVMYRVMREAGVPLSSAEVARRTLAAAGVSSPTAEQMKSIQNGFYRAVTPKLGKMFVRHDTQPQTYSVMA